MLLPHLADVGTETVSRSGGPVRITARATAPWAACPGCGSESIRDRSYTGSARQIRHCLAVTSWIMTRPEGLADADRASLEAFLAASPELAAVAASVRYFAAIMSERRGRSQLQRWMTAALAAGEPALRSFVTGLRADQDAVTNGLSLPWSSGTVEGHVNRIKMLERQMYGRANPDPLRRRVLLAD